MTVYRILFSGHAGDRGLERDVSREEVSRILQAPFDVQVQDDGTIKVCGIVLGRTRRRWIVAVVRAVSEGVWFVITTWPSGLRRSDARPKRRHRLRRRERDDPYDDQYS